jgi:hypothetical protein
MLLRFLTVSEGFILAASLRDVPGNRLGTFDFLSSQLFSPFHGGCHGRDIYEPDNHWPNEVLGERQAGPCDY